MYFFFKFWRFPMAFFTPIVTINETPPEPTPKPPKVKKIKIKIDGNKQGAISGEIVKPKRGRPRKTPDSNKVKDEIDDPPWAKLKDTKKKNKHGDPEPETVQRRSSRRKTQIVIKEETSDEETVKIKEEPKDEIAEGETVEIKKEIKEEPTDSIELPVILPLSEEEYRALMPTDSEEDKKFKCPLCLKEKQDETERYPKELKMHYKEQHPEDIALLSHFST
ncbi:unnamed protein product [Diabrotica balteata]|uniref:Uncharacterized protein n=1 Tax=Diabrotica balteata TaxID=107213 RepID=A0A9N9TDH3_DIABA|nr:unnamed protein product [Diabrotica balteata]